jgi:hypothetical protein
MTIQRSGFQNFVNTVNPPGVVGGIASQNPRAAVVGGRSQYRVDSGVIVGFFARFNPATGLAYGEVSPGDGILGFVANESQTIITEFLGQSRLAVQDGFPVTGYTHGDFSCLIAGASPAAVGDPVYAVAATGEPTTDDASGANPDTGFIVVSAEEVDATSSAGSIAANTGVLTIGGSVAGTWAPGMNLTGTGVPDNVFIQSQISGTPGGAGTYQTNYGGAAVTSTAMTGSAGKLVKISRTY